jgi:hypothetical protein
MSPRFLLAVFVVAALAAAGAARADDCDDVTPADGLRRVDAAAGMHAVEVVVPCALIDSGALGVDCADAFYVVNPQGTVLCRVEALAFSVDEAAPLLVRDNAEAAAAHAFVAVALAAEAPVLPSPPLAREVPSPAIVVDGGPADAHLFERPRPS